MLTTAVRFIIITQLLWAIRGSYTGFITQLFAPTTVITVVFVFVLAQLLFSKKSRRFGTWGEEYHEWQKIKRFKSQWGGLFFQRWLLSLWSR